MSKVKMTKADLVKLVGSKRAKAGDVKEKRVRTPAPPLPTHEPGSMDTVDEPYRERFDSRDEELFAGHLEQQRLSGHVFEWSYKAVKLRLGDGVWYTPDFRVINAEKTTIYYEIKGFLREAARVRLRTAAEKHPARFIMVRLRPKKHGGGWEQLYDSHAKRGNDGEAEA